MLNLKLCRTRAFDQVSAGMGVTLSLLPEDASGKSSVDILVSMSIVAMARAVRDFQLGGSTPDRTHDKTRSLKLKLMLLLVQAVL
jgi:hypothetical protein